MPRFDDYHRTVIGYHGTTRSVALRLVTRIGAFIASDRDYDWLGRGIYFWEYAPKQALNFAKIRQRQLGKKKTKSPSEAQRANEPLAVVACMIRLGFCLDLTEAENVEYLEAIYADYEDSMSLAGVPLPRNRRKYRKLDCAVFEYAYKFIERSEPTTKVDTACGIYVPKGGTKRIWDRSWIAGDTHIQLCVRNPANLLGTWLYHPTDLGVNNVCRSLQDSATLFERSHSQGEESTSQDAENHEDRLDG